VYEAIEDGRGHRVVAQIVASVFEHAIGSDDEAGAVLVARVHDRLQHLGGRLADAAREEQVIKDEQIGVEERAQDVGALRGAGKRVPGQFGVGFGIAHAVALQGGFVGDGLRDMAFACARAPDDQGVATVGDEL